MQGIALLVLTCVFLYVGRKILSFIKALQAIQYHPGNRFLLSPSTFLGSVLPRIPRVSVGSDFLFATKHQEFEAAGWDVLSSLHVWPKVETLFLLADAAAIKWVTLSRARYPKPVEQYEALAFYGPNIVASEHKDWKRYRKISAPAFSDRNYKLVWDESIQIMEGLFNDLWTDKDFISLDHCLEITKPIALFVIGIAAFGRRVSWKEDTVVPAGHTMAFKDALYIASSDFIYKLVLPNWALGLTNRMRKVKIAFEELHTYMMEMIRDRQAVNEEVERHDLFTSLLKANDRDLDLTESELISNIYIFLVAGHETTAHTLCFAFALLALHPGIQEELFEHIKSVTNGRPPTYEDMPLFTHCLAVFYETLRMFPPVAAIPKVADEDTSIVISNLNGEKKILPISKGTGLIIDTPGIHYNPRYWNDPHTFNPWRFLEKDWPRDAFIPFSAGARGCIGRKFAETESIAIITMLVSRYKITVKEEPRYANETFEERKTRILSARPGLTITPIRVPLDFTRR